MMSHKSGLKPEQIEEITERVMPVLIYNLLQAGKLDRSQLSDREYVWSAVLGCDDEVFGEGRTMLDDHFVEYAKKAIAAQDIEVAVVLVATVVEHRLNNFYVKALETKLPDKTINEILRNSIHAKLGWLMSLVTPSAIPDELKNKIKHLTDLRNAIVHYKFPAFDLAGPTTEGRHMPLSTQLNDLDPDDILTIPNELEQELEAILEETDPDYKMAKQVAEQILQRREK